MYGRRDTFEYVQGVQKFIECAREHMRVRDDRSIPCPCCDCQNVRREITVEAIKEHLITRGFVKGYNRWVMHGESKEDACNIAQCCLQLSLRRLSEK